MTTLFSEDDFNTTRDELLQEMNESRSSGPSTTLKYSVSEGDASVSFLTLPTSQPRRSCLRKTGIATEGTFRRRGVRFQRFHSHGPSRRCLIFKNGDSNIARVNVSKRKRRYLADFYTTLVEIQWRWNLLIFFMSFLITWLIGGILWWIISLIHGDFDPDRDKDTNDFSPCVQELNSFTSAFLFSAESQLTIGYGSRVITEHCPAAIILLCIQSGVGVLIGSFMVGVFFSKIARPKRRAAALIFSKKVVICKRNGKLCLLFRVGDWRKSRLFKAHVRVQMVKNKVTNEGEIIPFHPFDLKVACNFGSDQMILDWPCTVCHTITKDSPLWEISADDLVLEKFELVVILEGVSGSTSSTTQARTSYLPSEIIWGHRFKELVTYEKANGRYVIDYSSFNETYPVDTPFCSAKELLEIEGEDVPDHPNRINSQNDILNSSDDDLEDSAYDDLDDGDDDDINEDYVIYSTTSRKSLTGSILVHPSDDEDDDDDLDDDLDDEDSDYHESS